MSHRILTALSCALVLLTLPSVALADLSPEIKAKTEKYKAKLVEWAKDPAILQAVAESNEKGGLIPGMNNAKWESLGEDDPLVKGVLQNRVSKKLQHWEADKNINKLFVRDLRGTLVAGTTKTPIYSTLVRPAIREGLKGKPWNAEEVKRDIATQIDSVLISAPIMEEGKVIGVIHSAVTAD
jgi:hypothetical protein